MKSVNIMGKMTLRDIAKNFLQYLSMIIITMLAVTLFCGFISNALTLDKTLQDYYKASNLTDLICQYSVVEDENDSGLPAMDIVGLLKIFSAIEDKDSLDSAGITQLVSAYSVIKDRDRDFLQSLNPDSLEYRIYTEGSFGQKSAKVFICSPDNTVSLPVVTSGSRGVLIDKHVAEMDKINIGDVVDLELQVSPQGERISVGLAVTGTMNFPETADTHTYSPVYIDTGIFFDLLAPDLPQWLVDACFNAFCTQALIKTDSAAIKQQINDFYISDEGQSEASGFIFVLDRDAMESVVMLNNEISQSLNMIYVFPVIFMLVSILVILSTIGPMILKERTNIGTLKSIGISNRRILFHYSMFGVALCFIGGMLGVIAGPLIVPNVLLIKYGLVYSLPPFSKIVFSPLFSAVAVLSVCGLAALIGYAVCRKTSSEKPAACMRPMPPKENFIVKRASAAGKSTSQRNIPLKMAARNIIVKPSRAFMTIIGVAGCVALLVCSFGIGDTVNNSIDHELGVQFNYDIVTTFSAEKSQEFCDKIDTLKNNGAIETYDIFKTFYMSAKGDRIKDIKVFALPQNPQLTILNPDGKTLISKAIAEDIGVGKGDTIVLTAASGAYSLVIDEIIDSSFTKGVFVTDTGQFDQTFHTYNMWIKSEAADDLVEYINEINGTKGAYSLGMLREQVDVVMSSIQTIKLTMMVFSIALAVVVLYNLSLLNIKERGRDIATMKVLGFTTREIGRSLLFEIMLLVCLGTLIGLLLGHPITVLVMSINRVEVLTFLYKIKPLSYIISALLSVLTALTINVMFARPIRKINMTESLKSVE